MAKQRVQRRFVIDGQPMTPDQASAWIAANGMTGNLVTSAGDETLARAADFTRQCIRESEESKAWLIPVWDAMEHMLLGNSNFFDQPVGCDIHVPSLFSKIEALVPRVMQAAIGHGGEMLRCQGRDKSDRARANVTQEWLKYLLDQCGIISFGEDYVRSAVIYGFFMSHTWWDIKHLKRRVRESKQVLDKGQMWREISSVVKDQLVYEGMRQRLVHPRDAIIDANNTRVENMSYIGETLRKVPIVDLLAMEAKGIYSGVAAALEPNAKSRARISLNAEIDHMRGRSQAEWRDQYWPQRKEEKPTNGAPGYVDVDSLWAQWSDVEEPSEYDDFGEYQFIYVNECPVRVAKNPYDNQHRPYAIGRISKDPFKFYAVSPAMVGVRLNSERDQHRAYMSRNHQLSNAPITFTDPSFDVPENLMSVLPGATFSGVGKVEQLKFPSTLAEGIAMDELVNQDMNDAMGVLDAFQGRGEEGTATQFQGNRQEANNRIRRMVFAVADGFKQLAQHGLWLSQQFITDAKPFRVIGKGAGKLKFSGEITPEDLGDPVDIIMVGPEQFGSYGARATQISTFMNTGATLLNASLERGTLNPDALTRELYEGLMGHRLGDDILRDDLNAEDVLPQELENAILTTGTEVEVHELDDDEEHLRSMTEYFGRPEVQSKLTDEAKRAIYLHGKAHGTAMSMKEGQKQAQAAAQQRAMAAAPVAIGAGDGKKAPGDGNAYQPTADLRGPGPGQTSPREAPGPASPRTVSRPDRSMAIPQAQNAES